jgi:hypothetical protein
LNDDYRVQHIWPTHLANLLSATNVNISRGAASNDSILELTTGWLLENYIVPKKDTTELLVVVGWSTPERKNVMFENYDSSINKVIFWPTMAETKYYKTEVSKKYFDFYTRHLWIEREYITRYVEQHYALYCFCKMNNIKMVMFDAFNSPKKTEISDWQSTIESIIKAWPAYSTDGWFHGPDDMLEKQRLINIWNEIPSSCMILKDESPASFKGYIDQNIADADSRMNGLHPSESSHKVWADFLHQHINTSI